MKITKETLPNAAKAAGRVLKAKLKGEDINVPDEVYAKRLATCMTCEKYLQESQQCGVCTCLIFIKAKLTTEECPLKKW